MRADLSLVMAICYRENRHFLLFAWPSLWPALIIMRLQAALHADMPHQPADPAAQ